MAIVRAAKNTDLSNHVNDLIELSANEMSINLQIDQKMALSCYLTAASTALQGVADIRWPDGRVSPLSLFTLLLAGSGERKTTAFAEANSVVLAKNKDLALSNELRKGRYDNEIRIWSKKYKAVENKIVRETVQGRETEHYEKILKELDMERPKKPSIIDFVYKDSTSEALMQGLHDKSKYASLISSEGAGILNGSAFKNYASINDAWSGDDLKVDRKSTASSYVKGARLTIGVMVQNEIMNEFNKKNSCEFRASGLWARFLVFLPESRIGKRNQSGPIQSRYSSLFNRSCSKYIHEQINILERRSERKTMSLSREAAEEFALMCQHVESQTLSGGQYASFKDLASKVPENIIRLSAILSAFDNGLDVCIAKHYLVKAYNMVQICANDFMRVFYMPSEEDIDDDVLHQWLEGKRKLGYRYLKKNYIRRNVSSRLRNIDKLNASIDRLSNKGMISRFVMSNVQAIDMYPNIIIDYVAANHELFGMNGPFKNIY